MADARIRVRSLIAGRVRWEMPQLMGNPDLCDAIDDILRREQGVKEVSASALTGRVLLVFDSRLSVAPYESKLRELLADAAAGKLPARAGAASGHIAQKPKAATLTDLLNLTRRHRGRAIGTFLIAFVDRLFEAAPPAMIGAAVDVVTQPSGSFLARLGLKTLRSRLFALAGIFTVVWTLDSLMGYLHRVASARLAQAVQDDLRNQVYEHLQTLDIGQLEAQSVGAWTSLFDSDISRIGNFIETGIDPIVTMLTNSIIVTTTFLMQSPALFLAQLIIIPGLYVVSTAFLGPIRKTHIEAQRQSGQLSEALQGNISGVSTITVYGAQQREAERIRELSQVAREAEVTRAQVTAGYIPAIQMVVGVGFLTTLTWGAVLVEREEMSIAAFNVMGFTSLRLLVALGSLGMSLEQYQRTIVSVGRLVEFLNTRPQLTDGWRELKLDGPAELQFEHVDFQYEPGRPVLHNLDARIEAGKTIGIVGSTGAGKTTILKLILRFYDPTNGSIRINGTDIREIRLDDLRAVTAYVPQQIFLFRGTIRDNIAYSRPQSTHEEIVAAARAAQAHDFIEAMPQGYDTPIGGTGIGLSGGEQQRVAIARAILADRQVLLFDEATSAVDYETEAAIQNALREFAANRTILLIAHRLSTVRHADWIYVLDEGRVCEQGRHEDLLAVNGIYANLWRVQTGEPLEKLPAKRRSAKGGPSRGKRSES